MLLLLRPKAAPPPPRPHLPRSMASTGVLIASPSPLPGIPLRARPPGHWKSPLFPESMESQIWYRHEPPPTRVKVLARSGFSSAASPLQSNFRSGEATPRRGRPRQEPEPPDGEALALWLRRFAAEMDPIRTGRHRYPENRTVSTQMLWCFTGTVQLKAAAAQFLCSFGQIGFFGQRRKLVPDLLRKKHSALWFFLVPVFWMWSSLVPVPRGRMLSPMQTPEWLWYRDGFDVAHEDKRRRGAGKIKTAEDAENGVLSEE